MKHDSKTLISLQPSFCDIKQLLSIEEVGSWGDAMKGGIRRDGEMKIGEYTSR
jgi:hypothetical protein